jgi:hypothetical protein
MSSSSPCRPVTRIGPRLRGVRTLGVGRWRRVDGARTKTVSLDKSTSDVLINSIKQLYPLPRLCSSEEDAGGGRKGEEPFLKFIAGLRSSVARGPGDVLEGGSS